MKELPKRSTRGKRMNDLIGDEKEFDGIFWEQTIFKETKSDDEYKTESEHEDKYDDDFFHAESSDDEIPELKSEKREKPEKKPKPIKNLKKKKRLKIEKNPGITQKEMLEQAAITEMYNTYDLKKLLSLEENTKANLLTRREGINPTWRYTQTIKLGKRKSVIWHTEPLSVFAAFHPVKKICAVTGSLAKYTDPLTGKHYCNKEAFKKIRDEYNSKN
jgi:YL1 nuclear protein C-terminal domain/YL1 nuclear protein